MNTAWTPILGDELQKEINSGISKMSPRERALWGFICITPEKWKLSPWGDLGGGFWVVAVGGNTCIYYNDIEDGFNVSAFTQRGQITDYFCNQDELQWIIQRMMDVIDKSGMK